MRESAARNRNNDLDRQGEQASCLRGFAFTATLLLTSLTVACVPYLCTGSSCRWLGAKLDAYITLWTQSWTFYTGLSRNDIIVAYRVRSDGTPTAPVNQRESWSTWMWGLSRSNDGQEFNLERLAKQIPAEYWRECGKSSVAECAGVLRDATHFEISDDSTPSTACGLIAVAVLRPSRMPPGELPANARMVGSVAIADSPCRR